MMSCRPAQLLHDSVTRDYACKLELFGAHAEPELSEALASLRIAPGMRVFDAGCGTGEALAWLAAAVGPGGLAVGLDLATAHLAAARRKAPAGAALLQGDLARAPLAPGSFDLVWTANTINHFRDALAQLKALIRLLRVGGRIALGQSSLLPEMYFAWNSRLERLANEAVRRYYRDRYGISEHELGAVRSLVGLLRAANLQQVTVRTFTIERVAPLRPADERYLLEGIFRGTWGDRLRQYLSSEDFAELSCLCDPDNARYALRRPDFHFLQTFTLAVGTA
jgi:ubiquinone/menaquinone biosynthesis C-methylase UbiE